MRKRAFDKLSTKANIAKQNGLLNFTKSVSYVFFITGGILTAVFSFILCFHVYLGGNYHLSETLFLMLLSTLVTECSFKILSSTFLTSHLAESDLTYTKLSDNPDLFTETTSIFEDYSAAQKKIGIIIRVLLLALIAATAYIFMISIASGLSTEAIIANVMESKTLALTGAISLLSFILCTLLVILPYAIKSRFTFGIYVEEYQAAKESDLR